jgi:hypothetical protein
LDEQVLSNYFDEWEEISSLSFDDGSDIPNVLCQLRNENGAASYENFFLLQYIVICGSCCFKPYLYVTLVIWETCSEHIFIDLSNAAVADSVCAYGYRQRPPARMRSC